VCIFFALRRPTSDGIFGNTVRGNRLPILHFLYRLVETGPEYGMNKLQLTRDILVLNILDKRAQYYDYYYYYYYYYWYIQFIQLSFLKFSIS
jgi:hypothetical protein